MEGKRVKLFTFRYSATLGGFDDRPLAHFIGDKEVLTFREHFFCVNEVPHLLCVMTWQEALVTEKDLGHARDLRQERAPDPSRQPITPQASSECRKRSAAPDPTEGLDEGQRTLFNTLREWRSAKAREEGVPPYLVFTNKHLIELVTTLPDSPTALSNLHGIGPGKVKRYGEEVLKLLAAMPPEQPVVEALDPQPAEVTG